jgi:hypothetical protein
VKQKLTKDQERWVCALEKGKVGNRIVTKGRGRLHETETNKYCCLGVAELTLNKKVSRPSAGGLTGESASRLKLRSTMGHITGMYSSEFKGKTALAFLNDDTKITHKGIAKLIRKYPEAVFLP